MDIMIGIELKSEMVSGYEGTITNIRGVSSIFHLETMMEEQEV